jgi:hypothetical protein
MGLSWKNMTDEQKARRMESQRKYKEKYPEKVRQAKKNWFKKNPGYFNEWSKKNFKRNPWQHILRVAKSKAKKEGIPFNLKISDLVIPEVCPVLGIKLVAYNGENRKRNDRPTLDRMVPSLGYVKSNVRVISFRANRVKNNCTLDELRAVIRYMENSDTTE